MPKRLTNVVAGERLEPPGQVREILNPAAREFRSRIQCGMLGVNAGVPAPMAFFAFGGRKASLFGDLRVQGADSIEFYTQKKSVIERWFGFGETGSTWAK